MEDNDKVRKALDCHNRNCNCCQSVIDVFAADLDSDPVQMHRAAEAFGRGMGGKNGTCGALSGALFVAGLKYSDGDLEHPASKEDTYVYADRIFEKFREQAHSTVCRELRGEDTGEVLTPCEDCIAIAVRLCQDVLSVE